MYKRGEAWYSDFYWEGKRYRKSWGAISEALAREEEGAWRKSIKSGDYARQLRRIKFETLAEKYLEYAEINKKPKTVRKNRSSMNMLKIFFRGRYISAIGPDLAEKFKRQRLAAGKAPATVNRDIDVLRNMMQKAVEWGYLTVNTLTVVKHLKEDNEKMWVLTPAEEEKLLCECEKRPQRKKNRYLRDLVEFALHTGLRLDEVFGLQKKRVHLKERWIDVVDTKTTRRSVPLNETAAAIVKRRLMGWKSRYLFCNHRGERIPNITKAFWTSVAKAGLEYIEIDEAGNEKKTRFRFHDLRHTFGSRLGMAGFDTKTIMEIMGHKTHKMAMRYQHPAPDHKLNAVRFLDTPPEIPTAKIVPLKKGSITAT